MAYSQAHDFSITDATFNDVHGNYNHNESTSNPQSICLAHLTGSPDTLGANGRALPSLSVAGAYGSNVGGNQTNHIYISLPAGNHKPNPPFTQAPQVQCKDVDISIILDTEVKRRRKNLDWRQSIVDLMKVLRVDSSLAARRRLATGAGYDGDQNDTWTMNIWLHRYVKDVVTVAEGDLKAAQEALMRRMV